MWSRERHEWINLMFDAMNPEAQVARRQQPITLPVLQEAEQHFLARIGHPDPSPYFFSATYGEPDD
jgi:hypothetical protein